MTALADWVLCEVLLGSSRSRRSHCRSRSQQEQELEQELLHGQELGQEPGDRRQETGDSSKTYVCVITNNVLCRYE